MMHEVQFAESAIEDLRCLAKHEQRVVVEAVEQQLVHEPLTETRNRKPLRPNDLSQWELRADRFRVFYDVDEIALQVKIEAVGYKKGNKLLIHGQEYQL